MADPFAAFGDDDSDSDSPNDATTKDIDPRPQQRRDKSCGVLTFHAGTEQALLHYVRNELDKHKKGAKDTPASCQQVLDAVDNFCRRRHWMMHVGDEKGQILERFLLEALQTETPSRREIFSVVELGTYCGYSAIRMAKTALEYAQQTGKLPIPVQIISVDVDKDQLKVAQEMIELAGISSYVTLLCFDERQSTILSNLLSSTLKTKANDKTNVPVIDFLFLDHVKDRYLPDVKELESARLIQQHSFVCADNVVFHGLHEYRDYMEELAKQGVVETRLETSLLEYSSSDIDGQVHRDGLGRCSSSLLISVVWFAFVVMSVLLADSHFFLSLY